MSRLGKKPIAIPPGTEVKVTGSTLSVKGPKGTLTRVLHPLMELSVTPTEVSVKPKKETPESPVLWGTWVSHIFNMIEGVNKGFEKRLLIEGVGYKADVKGSEIILSVGYSHPVSITIPKDIKVVSDKNGILISGFDIEQVGDFTARVRAVKKPEPYKGKGIRYATEVIRRKQGKKTV
ncbi:MAG TPA: 50S ribosomal protein L6 [Candidatus Paceibacterota bacterium]